MSRISVVIPAYQSVSTLAACLEALRAQTFRDFEVIVINSSQETETAKIAAAYPEVKFRQSPERLYPHAARNQGMALASGAILVCTDPDCTAAPDWLAQLVSVIDAGHQIVGGAMGLQDNPTWLECGIHLVKFFSALPGLAESSHSILPTANVAFTREVWQQAGPFDGNLFAGDAIFSWRANQKGFALRFASKAVVFHSHQESLAAICKQRFQRGYEFALAKAAEEEYPAARSVAYILASPALTFLLLLQAFLCSWRAGWTKRFFSTLPAQFLGQLTWVAGETKGYWKRLTSCREACAGC